MTHEIKIVQRTSHNNIIYSKEMKRQYLEASKRKYGKQPRTTLLYDGNNSSESKFGELIIVVDLSVANWHDHKANVYKQGKTKQSKSKQTFSWIEHD